MIKLMIAANGMRTLCNIKKVTMVNHIVYCKYMWFINGVTLTK